MTLTKKLSVYIFPLLLIVAVTLFKFSFNAWLGHRTPFLLYTGVVIATTWYSGWAIGLATNFICLFVIDYFFLEPYFSFVFPARITIQMVVFTAQNLLLAAMGFSMNRALNRSEAAENKFRLLVEQACELLILRDKSGKVTYVNPKVKQLFGYTAEEFAAQGDEKLYTPSSLQLCREAISAILETPGTNRSVKLEFIHKDGRRGWLEGELFNYLDEPGIHALVAHYRDVTERVNIERQKDSFIGIASHELKTPLTSLKAYLQVMEVRAKKNQDAFFADALGKANQQIKKMTTLINGFLNLSRFESGKLQLDQVMFDVSELIQEIVNEFRLIMPGREIMFSSDSSPIIRADREKIGSVITNLVSNAAKYSAGGKPIHIAVQQTHDHVQVSISDQGVGIRPEDQNRLFERYYRANSEQNKNVSGFGIGLYLSAEIIKLHQGKIWLTSEIGHGSTFYISLPYGAAEA
jgi:PAS domain S-box-containing protein